ncbi:transcription factor bHLH147-like [Rosa rugosa]|uniref:transcription factor bHLH147-like n=1 Tax=Rosa rugosa TaxID=74645 RepID=UPI002B41762A|nr:transcription factor bHLH147-like [Rosa rugosa]
MASTLISNPVTTSDRPRDSSRIQRKKKKKLQAKQDHHLLVQHSQTKWKSEAQQQIYSSKLLQALNQVSAEPRSQSSSSSSSSSTCPPPRRGRAVREAADRVLAVAAKGRTRWSRAILTNRLKLKFRQHRKQQRAAAATGTGRLKKQKFSVFRLKGKGLPAVQRKVRVLGRLVPGCRKQPLPVILEEATDYIAALEMQVRAMSRLTQLLSVSGSTSGAGGSSSSPPPS